MKILTKIRNYTQCNLLTFWFNLEKNISIKQYYKEHRRLTWLGPLKCWYKIMPCTYKQPFSRGPRINNALDNILKASAFRVTWPEPLIWEWKNAFKLKQSLFTKRNKTTYSYDFETFWFDSYFYIFIKII